MNIFLVRHAQSLSNVNHEVLKLNTNMSIRLSSIGEVQAKETGDFFSNHFILNKSQKTDIKIWNSPYHRTRQTSQEIKNSFNAKNIKFSEEESIYISERQFGLVDDVVDYNTHFQHESKHFNLHRKSNHDFFARPPLGESPFDMCMRLDFFLKTILANESNIENHIVVSHGAAIRGLIMMQQKHKYETFTCPNPYNASVRLIADDIYHNQIFCPSNITG
ncbi:phosphoglycerate mutase family protein [archaeon]|nr:phosphoglycerate mutase family protein [archaeon]